MENLSGRFVVSEAISKVKKGGQVEMDKAINFGG